ncbi:prolyl endopeptidase [Streptococcus vestibularis]|uniref:prolyl endopeptidase n=1 Tax=uncultured Streptococcus sp. TaxID=83427 RepID=UPI0026EE046A|nr:prolyl endopeptidase [Streptococcus vestibularis]
MLGLTVAQTTDADSYTFQNGDLFFSIASQGYAVGSICAARSIVCWTDGGYGYVGYVTPVG